MRKYQKDGEYDVFKQIVLPYQLHARVLLIAHDIPASGHLGVTKTRNRL